MKKLINKIWMILLLVTFYSCQQEDHPSSELHGSVSFGGISLEFAPMGSPGSRITENSPWVHVFPDAANLVFTKKTTGQEYVLEFNPNDFSTPYSITLPYGAYEYHSTVEGGVFSAFLPFEARGEFSLDSKSLEISLEAATGYGLVTVKEQYVEKASISDGEKETNLVGDEEGKYWFMYVKGGTATNLNIEESFQGSTISRELNIAANRHYNFVLKLNEDGAAITGLILAPFDLEEEEILLGWGSKFFEENGTIKCQGAAPGEKGMVNDKVYEAVDRSLLVQRRDEGADLSCVCTSLVMDMSGMFGDPEFSYITNLSDMFERASDFNQPIGNWDVSNVTDMRWMFGGAQIFNQSIENWDVGKVTNMNAMFMLAEIFNQPIGNWDVSKVADMSWMFELAMTFNQPIGNWDVGNVREMRGMFVEAKSFNQPIGNWNVSNVTNMSGLFSEASSFNQPIGNWDVSKVTNMGSMFSNSSATYFNQPIGNWDVSKVTDMTSMFEGAIHFNQPIGNWDVGNVTNMKGMFAEASSFNQPIGNWDVSKVTNMGSMFRSNHATYFNQSIVNWDVSKVTDMTSMFEGAINFNQPIGDWDVGTVSNMSGMFNNARLFNQNLREWCVQNIPSEPENFSTESALLNANKPLWGTCPE